MFKWFLASEALLFSPDSHSRHPVTLSVFSNCDIFCKLFLELYFKFRNSGDPFCTQQVNRMQAGPDCGRKTTARLFLQLNLLTNSLQQSCSYAPSTSPATRKTATSIWWAAIKITTWIQNSEQKQKLGHRHQSQLPKAVMLAGFILKKHDIEYNRCFWLCCGSSSSSLTYSSQGEKQERNGRREEV